MKRSSIIALWIEEKLYLLLDFNPTLHPFVFLVDDVLCSFRRSALREERGIAVQFANGLRIGAFFALAAGQ